MLCLYGECRILFIVMVNVIILSVVMLNVVMLSVVMLSVVAPSESVCVCVRKKERGRYREIIDGEKNRMIQTWPM